MRGYLVQLCAKTVRIILLVLYAPCACLHASVQSCAKDLNKYIDEGPGHGTECSGSLFTLKGGKGASCFGLPDGGYHQYPYSSLYIAVLTQDLDKHQGKPKTTIALKGFTLGGIRAGAIASPNIQVISRNTLLSYELV